MMTWNYRVFQEEDGDYVVREVFYDEGGSIVACTADAVEPVGSTVEELGQCLDNYRAALAQPVLTLRDIPEAAPRSKNLVTGNAVPQADFARDFGLESIQDDKDALPRAGKPAAAVGLGAAPASLGAAQLLRPGPLRLHVDPAVHGNYLPRNISGRRKRRGTGRRRRLRGDTPAARQASPP